VGEPRSLPRTHAPVTHITGRGLAGAMELPGSSRTPVRGARRAGVPRPDERVEVTLLLRRRSDVVPFPTSDVFGGPTLSQRRYLSREDFGARHGAHPKDRERVRAFAVAAGLEIVADSAEARTVRLAGPLFVVERAFGVRLERWTSPGGAYRGRSGAIHLPDDLVGVVVGVFGLDNRPQARPHFRRRTLHAASDVSYSPPTVGAAYDFPAGTTGSGQTIALLELGGGYTPADLDAFFRGLGISTPSITAVSIDGATNAPTGDPNGPDGEVELDVEVAGSVAPGSHLVVYFAPNTDQGFLDGLNAAVHDTTNRPSIISVSWGSPESSWTAQARDALNSVCEDASTMGITITVAAGDAGASDGEPAGTLEVDFPASSPYVLGCGGTRLVLSGSSIVSETTWNELSAGEGATGGGVSRVFPLPSFQASTHVPPSPAGIPGRGVPDVAGDADPSSGYAVTVDGASDVVGGTSAVAPLWAALVARMNQALGTSVGYANPVLYAPGAVATFHDITTGDNGGYSAGPGWDPCTGLGSPDGARLLAALRAASPAP
jgi:kumamolisin